MHPGVYSSCFVYSRCPVNDFIYPLMSRGLQIIILIVCSVMPQNICPRGSGLGTRTAGDEATKTGSGSFVVN